MTARPLIRTAEEGDQRWFFGGGLHTWKVTDADSGGSCFLFVDELAQGKVTPWHSHADSDELVYVLQGEVELNLDGQSQRLGEGGMWLAPRGVPHAFRVVSDTARLLDFQTPGNGGAFYWDASEPPTGAVGELDFARVGRAAEATGATTMLGPPPFD